MYFVPDVHWVLIDFLAIKGHANSKVNDDKHEKSEWESLTSNFLGNSHVTVVSYFDLVVENLSSLQFLTFVPETQSVGTLLATFTQPRLRKT